MAIKAGLVGVNPKGVDKNGMPIGSGGGSVDAYTKAETDTLLNGKVSNSQLTANNKAFHFAYDNTSEKYGYKLDGTGDFIPFDVAGGVGINLPDASIAGLTFGTGITYVKGGYQIADDVLYLDITVKNTTAGTSGRAFSDIPNTGKLIGVHIDTTADKVGDLEYFNGTPAVVNSSNTYVSTVSANTAQRYILFSDQRTT